MNIPKRFKRGLLAAYTPRLGCYKVGDNSGILDGDFDQPSVANGDVVEAWFPVLGYRNMALRVTATGDGKAALLATGAAGINGFPALVWDAVDDAMLITPGNGDQFNKFSPWCFYAIVGGVDLAAGTGILFQFKAQAIRVASNHIVQSGGAASDPRAGVSTVGWCACAVVAGVSPYAGSVTAFVNGKSIASVSGSSISSGTVATTRKLAVTDTDSRLGDLLLYTGVKHSPSESNAISRWLLGRYGLTY